MASQCSPDSASENRFYIRQFAFLRSLAPYEEVEAPDFSFEELAILSFKADKSRLPPLPLDPPFIPERLRHVPAERLALEAMYRSEPRLSAFSRDQAWNAASKAY